MQHMQDQRDLAEFQVQLRRGAQQVEDDSDREQSVASGAESARSQGRVSAHSGTSSQRIVVKNTFISVIDLPPGGRLGRSHSESELSMGARSNSVSGSATPLSQAPSQALSQVDALRSNVGDGEGSQREDHSFSTSDRARGGHGDDSYDGGEEDLSTTTASFLADSSTSFPSQKNTDPPADVVQNPDWSTGTALHATGQCKPCLYLTTASGCSHGSKCRYCHANHKREGRQRPCKSMRNQCKRIAAMLDFDKDANVAEASERLARQSTYMRQLLKGKQGQTGESQAQSAPSGAAGSSAAHGTSHRSSTTISL